MANPGLTGLNSVWAIYKVTRDIELSLQSLLINDFVVICLRVRHSTVKSKQSGGSLHTAMSSQNTTGLQNQHPVNCLLVGCLTSQHHASVSQGRICSDNCTCCHTEIEVADPTFYLTQSQYTDTGPAGPSANSITPGAWQGSHQCLSHWYDSTRKNPVAESSALEAEALTTRPARRCGVFVPVWYIRLLQLPMFFF